MSFLLPMFRIAIDEPPVAASLSPAPFTRAVALGARVCVTSLARAQRGRVYDTHDTIQYDRAARYNNRL